MSFPFRMNRRHFFQKLSLVGAPLLALPMLSFENRVFPKTGRLKFITASDGHWGQPGTDYEAAHRELIEAIHREKDVDFVLFNGDLIHDDATLLPEVKGIYDQLQVPYCLARGNHDRVSEAEFFRIMGQPTNHAFPIGDDMGAIILDCSNEKGEYRCVDLDLAKTFLNEYADLSHVFVFVHISQNDWTRHGIDCKPLLDLLASYPAVRATFHGHDHDVDGQMIYRGKPFLWSGHFGGSWGNPFPSYRVCEVDARGKASTYLKTVREGVILNAHSL